MPPCFIRTRTASLTAHGDTSGVTCATRVVGYDLLPTLCALAGVTQALPAGVEGGDFSGLFAAGTGTVRRAHEELVFHFPHYQGDTPHSAILLGDYKLMKWYEDGRTRLFNLADDLGERNDLASCRPEQARDLEQRLDRCLRAVGAHLPRRTPRHDPSAPAPALWRGRGRQHADLSLPTEGQSCPRLCHRTHPHPFTWRLQRTPEFTAGPTARRLAWSAMLT